MLWVIPKYYPNKLILIEVVFLISDKCRSKSYTLIEKKIEPTKIHIVKDMLIKVPKIAPFELAKGTNIPKRNKPSSGPPITPNNDSAALNLING